MTFGFMKHYTGDPNTFSLAGPCATGNASVLELFKGESPEGKVSGTDKKRQKRKQQKPRGRFLADF
jgi:hypothetical protein